MDSSVPRFICDHMLGSLAKWLRLLGYDTVYPAPLGDRQVAARTYDEGRVLLTRDKDLAARVKGSIYVASDELDEQLAMVVKAVNLDLSNSLSLCSVCNVPITDIERESVKGEVPPAVFELQTEFWKCQTCGRLYWRGTHWEDIVKRIERLKGQSGLKSHKD